MRLEFDTANMAEVTAVAALIAHLRGGETLQYAGGLTITGDVTIPGSVVAPNTPAPTPAGQSDIVPPPPADTGNDDAPDAASAFGGAGAGAASPAVTSPVPPPPPVTVGAVEVDADGLPWDARIHATPASKNKGDQKWRAKRGLDAATAESVTAELRRTMGAPAAPLAPAAAAPAVAAPPPPPAPPAPPVPPAPAPTESGPAAATTAASPPPPPPPAPAADDAVTDFASLMRKVTRLQTAGVLTVEETTANAKALGIDGLRGLMARPDLIPSFDQLLPVVPA